MYWLVLGARPETRAAGTSVVRRFEGWDFGSLGGLIGWAVVVGAKFGSRVLPVDFTSVCYSRPFQVKPFIGIAPDDAWSSCKVVSKSRYKRTQPTANLPRETLTR